MGWDIGYARTDDGIDIAYACLGEGRSDVVLLHGFTTHLDFIGDSTWHAYWARRLSERFRLIQLDKRGTGLSDRTLGHGSIEDRMRDLLAVMDAAGSERASIVGISEGGPIALTFAAAHPERVDRLALYGTYARIVWAPDHPDGIPAEDAQRFTEWLEASWGSGQVIGTMFLTHAPDPEAAIRAMARFERNACTPQMAGEIMRRNVAMDVRALLPAIAAPTIVVHNAGDPLVPVRTARRLAEQIPGATYVEGDGDYHCTWNTKEFEPLMDRVVGFLDDGAPDGDAGAEAATSGGAFRPPALARRRRSVATILFTDLVGSTDRAAALGDDRWRELLSQHHQRANQATAALGGTVVKTTGDGILALFDGPSRAIAAAQELRTALADLDLELRAGVHTGEVERTDDDVVGIGVHIAARAMSLAGAGEAVATRTVHDLAAGSGIGFEPRGEHELRGVPGRWELYAVRLGATTTPAGGSPPARPSP